MNFGARCPNNPLLGGLRALAVNLSSFLPDLPLFLCNFCDLIVEDVAKDDLLDVGGRDVVRKQMLFG